MRRVLSLTLAAVCTLLLSSCGLPPIEVPLILDHQKAGARMEQIAAALNAQDAPALKEMFSPYALEEAKGLDEGIQYLLSFFPNGGVTWERSTIDSSRASQDGKASEVLLAIHKLTADGVDYKMFFADFTVNELINPRNVGIYAIGVTPWTDDPREGASAQFGDWAGSVRLETNIASGYPGVYVPRDDYVSPEELADARMSQIAVALGEGDADALRDMFSPNAITDAIGFERQLAALLNLFTDGDVSWEQRVVNNSGGDSSDGLILRTTQYKVSSNAKDYWFFFADFELHPDPDSVGLAALALAPWSEPGTADPDQFDEWSSSWIADGMGPAGILVSTD